MKSASETVASSDNDRVLVIMAKAPRPGAVKTRLAPSLSPRRSLSSIAVSCDDTVALARSLGDVEVAIMCPDAGCKRAGAVGGQQGERSCAERRRPCRRPRSGVCALGGRVGQRRIIAFNSDSPHLPRSVLEDAFETLAAHDVVVGPTHDGGYYLVGAKASHPTLFARDGMGTSSALERLLSRARALELSVGFADPFYDIDVADDLTRLAEELRLAPARAPRTAAWLKEWELVAAQSRTGTEEQ